LNNTQLDSDLSFIHRSIPPKEKSKTTLLVLHGTGGDEDDLIPLAKMIDDQAAILSPRGKVLENGMPRFFRRLAEGVFDIEDLKLRTNELADFVTKASRKYNFDPKSVIALGYSNGANIAASMLLLGPESLKGAILFRAMIPLQPETTPDLSDKRIFVSAGRYDSIIPQDKTIELVRLFESAGANVTMNWEDSTHALTQGEIEKAKNWLKQEGK
jgi:phospholipase/carboxylesterase